MSLCSYFSYRVSIKTYDCVVVVGFELLNTIALFPPSTLSLVDISIECEI